MRSDERMSMERIDWDEFSERYDRQFLEDPLYRECLRTIVEQVVGESAPRVLDLGCGTGGVTHALLGRIPGAKVTGVDPAEGMRRVYGERFKSVAGVDVRGGNGLHVPAPDGEFDFVVSNLALHHIPRQEKAACAREVSRVLRDGGTFIYCDHFIDLDGPRTDPARCRDIIDKTVGWAMYSLDHGAYDHMLGLLRVLSLCIAEEGEYLETPGRWDGLLQDAGFGPARVVDIPPVKIGMKVLVSRSGPAKK
jgi:ubiquinone/menaquinone biosynthesis C-methylase UbiE